MPLSLERIRSSITRYQPRALDGADGMRRAAVALILREAGSAEGVELLMIRRSEHPSDPWSGHMAFPGGRVEPVDATVERAAVRETQEELGFSLDTHARPLGALSEVQARSRSQLLAMCVRPVVFELTQPVGIRTNSEVVEALWIPIRHLRDPATRAVLPHSCDGVPPGFPRCIYRERVIWGLSLLMLDELLYRVLRE